MKKQIRFEIKRRFKVWAERLAPEDMDDGDKLFGLLLDYGIIKYVGFSRELSSKVYSFGGEHLFSGGAIRDACWELAKEYANK